MKEKKLERIKLQSYIFLLTIIPLLILLVEVNKRSSCADKIKRNKKILWKEFSFCCVYRELFFMVVASWLLERDYEWHVFNKLFRCWKKKKSKKIFLSSFSTFLYFPVPFIPFTYGDNKQAEKNVKEKFLIKLDFMTLLGCLLTTHPD